MNATKTILTMAAKRFLTLSLIPVAMFVVVSVTPMHMDMVKPEHSESAAVQATADAGTKVFEANKDECWREGGRKELPGGAIVRNKVSGKVFRTSDAHMTNDAFSEILGMDNSPKFQTVAMCEA